MVVRRGFEGRWSAAVVLVAASLTVAGCGTPKESETTGSATDACAPLTAIKAEATKILAATPASTSPKGSTPSADPVPTAPESAAQAISALSHRVGPVADQLDKVAASAGTQSGSEQNQVTGLLTAELALRRVALALAQKKFTEASIANEDFHNAAKAAGLTCASPLGDNTRVEMQALPTT